MSDQDGQWFAFWANTIVSELGIVCRFTLGLAAVGCVNGGDGVVASIYICVQMSDSMLFLDACFMPFCRLPMICLLTVLFLVLVSRNVGRLVGPAASRLKRLGRVAIPLGLALALPLLICWVCLGLSPAGGSSVAVCSMTGVLRLIFRW